MARRKKKKNSRNDRQPVKAPPVEVRKRFNILLITLPATAVFLVLIPAIGYYYLTAERSMPAPGLEGLDVVLGGDKPFSITVALSPHFAHAIIDAVVSINDSKEILPSCTDVTYIIPGISLNHRYLLPANFPRDKGFDSAQGIHSSRRPLENVKRDPFGSNVVMVQLQQTPDFSGAIEFLWDGCISRKSFSEYELLIPFCAAGRNGIEWNSSQSFRVSMLVRNDYRLVKHSVPVHGQKSLGEISIYWFDIQKSNSILHLIFESDRLKVAKQRWQWLCVVGFGLGLSVLVAQFVAMYKHHASRDGRANGGSNA